MKTLLIIFISLLLSSVCEAKSLYVNNSGSPACSDDTDYAVNTALAPWCTILRAVRGTATGNRNDAAVAAQAAKAGDTVYITAGTYNYTGASYNQGGFGGESLYESINSGTSGAWITYQAVGGYAEIPGNTGGSAQQIGSYSAQYIKFVGFKVVQADIGYRAGGALITIWADNVWIEGFEVVGSYYTNPSSDNHAGIMIHGPGTTDCVAGADNVTIRNSKIYGFTGNNSRNDASITTYCLGNNLLIEHNEIYSSRTGINTKSNWTRVTGTNIRYNLFHTLSGDSIAMQSSSGWNVYQNIMRDVDSGFLFFNTQYYVGAPTQPYNVYVVNNTIDNAAKGMYFKSPCSQMDANYIQNNIITNSTNAVYVEGVDCTQAANINGDDIAFNYNVYEHSGSFFTDDGGGGQSFGTWQGTFGQDANSSTSADCLYTNEAGNVFTLQAGSPCKSGQTNAGVDILNLLGGGTGGAINLGAYVSTGQTEVIGIEPAGTTPDQVQGVTIRGGTF